LIRHLREVLPADAGSLLDVGCGDGTITRAVGEGLPEEGLHGVDVLVRPETAVPVQSFDGKHLPFEDDSVDVTMFVDVLHHTDDPNVLLAEAARVSRQTVIIKDHCYAGRFDHAVLSFMDWVGNRAYGVRLPYNYWTKTEWDEGWREHGLEIAEYRDRLGIYPAWAGWVFDRELHFIASLRVRKQ
jgi:SAM-dependent methyltransferase